MSNAPFAPAGIDHIVLCVADVARARAFYEGVLGLTLERARTRSGCGNCAREQA